MSFVNLYLSSEYSLLNSTIKIPQLIEYAKNHNIKTLAICDNNMGGVIKFYQGCRAANIKPLIGLKLQWQYSDNIVLSLLLYACNKQGYLNLLKLSSYSEINKQPLSTNIIQEYTDGLLAILPISENRLLNTPNGKIILEIIDQLHKLFEHMFIGFDFHTTSAQQINSVNNFCIHNNLAGVVLHRTHFLEDEDYEAFTILRAIDGGSEYSEVKNERHLFYPDSEYLNFYYHDFPSLIANTEAISNLCNVEINFSGYQMPRYSLPAEDIDPYLSQLCKVGLNKRLRGKTNVDINAYRDRLLYELDVIHKMQFSDYFLIVYDFVKFAKQNNILVGPGRGSAPGSLVSYCLGITDVDPIKHGLIFERFLNLERANMPDIDLDFPDKKRDLVIKYLLEKYGKYNVAYISTFGRYAARMCVRDVARVLRVSTNVLEEVLHCFPQSEHSLAKILENSETLQQMFTQNREVNRLLTLALKIEGLPKHTSTHAAGIIITDRDIRSYTGLQTGMNGLYQTQLEANDLEDLGLVKIDLLALKNLTIIEDVIKLVQQATSKEININQIPLDDKQTLQLIAAGQTNGVFQLESNGMKNVLRSLKVDHFDDIVHANALFRPGPLEMIDTFIRRKEGREKITYLHPDLKDILKPTYGIIIFQEQIMLIAEKFAGYSLGMADILRRGISKKDAQILESEKQRFIGESVSQGYDAKIAAEVYDYIAKFANYGFNKNHAVAYSLIAYQMAYLKAHYYLHFMAVLLQNSLGSMSTMQIYINEVKAAGYEILLPNINISDDFFKVSSNGLYYPLTGVLGINDAITQQIIAERNKNGKFVDFENFISRTRSFLPKRLVENLIYAGALDSFNVPRKYMIEDYDNAIQRITYSNLFTDEIVVREVTDEEYPFEVISNKEKESLGINLKYNILLYYAHYKSEENIPDLRDVRVGQRTKVLAIVERIHIITTKQQKEMAFLAINDGSESLDAVIFPDAYQKNKGKIEAGSVYELLGHCNLRNNKRQFVVENVYILK